MKATGPVTPIRRPQDEQRQPPTPHTAQDAQRRKIAPGLGERGAAQIQTATAYHDPQNLDIPPDVMATATASLIVSTINSLTYQLSKVAKAGYFPNMQAEDTVMSFVRETAKLFDLPVIDHAVLLEFREWQQNKLHQIVPELPSTPLHPQQQKAST
jgi:hypothetical protein